MRTILISLFGAAVSVWLVVSFLISPDRYNREATLILAFENEGKGRIFQGEVVAGMTIFDALIASSEAGQIKLDYDMDSDNKIKIETLNGYYDILKDQYLVFYLNNGKIDRESIHTIEIKPGDTVEVRLE